jgi:flagellar protein FliO/FliZ
MELNTYFRFLLALVFVIALIGILAWLARRAGLGTRVARKPGSRKRLSISEVSAVDGKRRLLLVRRDDVEHLVLLGPGQDVVIEQGIPAPPDAPDERGAGQIPFTKALAAVAAAPAKTTRKRKARSSDAAS